MFQYVLFDLDGTLTDPREGITKSVQFALAQQGISEPDLKKLEPFIGPPLKDSFMEFYGMTEEQAAQEEYERRLKRCRTCQWLRQGVCGKCGCFVEARAYRKRAVCPHEEPRW